MTPGADLSSTKAYAVAAKEMKRELFMKQLAGEEICGGLPELFRNARVEKFRAILTCTNSRHKPTEQDVLEWKGYYEKLEPRDREETVEIWRKFSRKEREREHQKRSVKNGYMPKMEPWESFLLEDDDQIEHAAQLCWIMQLARFHSANTQHRLQGKMVEEMRKERERVIQIVRDGADVWLPHDTKIDPQEWYWMMVKGSIISFQRKWCQDITACGYCRDCWEGKWLPEKRVKGQNHGIEVVYLGMQPGQTGIVVRTAVLRYEELRKLVMPGGVKIVEEGTRFGPMGLHNHWRKWYFDQEVVITGVQHVYDTVYRGKSSKLGRVEFPLVKTWLDFSVTAAGLPFPAELMKSLESHRVEGSNEWVKIKAGAALPSMALLVPAMASLVPQNAPVASPVTVVLGSPSSAKEKRYSVSKPRLPVPHRQGEGTYVCYSSSLASVLAIFAKKGNLENKQELLEASRRIHQEGMEIGCPWDLKRKVYRLAERELKECGYKMQRCIEYIEWEDGELMRPMVMEIAGRTNYPHCVGVLGGWIIDPTEPYALERTRENLDILCGGHYVSTLWAMEVRPIEDGDVCEICGEIENRTTVESKACKKRRRKT